MQSSRFWGGCLQGSWHCIVIALWNFLLALILRFILSATSNWDRYCPVRPSTQVIPYIHSIVVKYIQPRLFNPKRVWIVVGSLGNWRCRRNERSLNWLSHKDRFLALRTIPFAREEWHTMYVADIFGHQLTTKYQPPYELLLCPICSTEMPSREKLIKWNYIIRTIITYNYDIKTGNICIDWCAVIGKKHSHSENP